MVRAGSSLDGGQDGTADVAVEFDGGKALSVFRERHLFDPVCRAPGAGPYHRPTRANWPLEVFGAQPLTQADLGSMNALEAHRVLFNIYEQDMLFLPRQSDRDVIAHMADFYDPSFRRLGDMVRPDLEQYCLGFLDDAIDVSSDWDENAMFRYFDATVRSHEQSKSSLLGIVEASHDPQASWRNVILQSAGDFLTEASAMARLLPGNYGPLQSAFFRIFIDEYGYGVHSAKHSTLFEILMDHLGLDSRPHTYFGLYLTSSLAVHNYIHWICRNKPLFFRYVGAAYFAEATYVHTCEEMAESLARVFPDGVDGTYFLEHAHIDRHHRRMLKDDLVLPAIALYGPDIIPEIVRGFEEFRWLVGWWCDDVCRQLEEIDRVLECRSDLRQASDRVVAAEEILRGDAGVGLALTICDRPVYYWCEEGDAYLQLGFGEMRRLSATDVAVVSAGRPHALVATGNSSVVLRRGELPSR